nr:integrase, catalytic region, zinc finger, CCHC-type, peptidase aspartic, catalytic [Tanacetum cinerariifolium]
MSRDVITIGSTMRIPLLYRGKYSQWRERFMNYLEEQTDGEAMINSIQNDPKFWTIEKKKTRKIDRLARSLLIQGLPNGIYSLIDSNETAKDLWDALERQMHGSKYGEQDRKAAILYECETFKANEGEQLLDTYLRYLQYGTLMRKTKNLMDINIDALYNILKQNQGDVNDALGYKKKDVVINSDPLALSANKKQEFVKSDDKKEDKKANEKKRDMSKVKCYNCKKERHFAKDCKKAKVKDYNYYKTKMLLAKKDSDEQVLLADDQAWMEIYDNSINYSLFVNNDDDQEIFHDAIESASENFIKNHIDSQKDYDKSEVDHNDYKEKEHLVDKLIRKFNRKIAKCQKRIEKANQQSKDFEHQNKDLQEKYDVLINQVNTFEEQNNVFNEQIKVLNEKNADLLDQTNVLKDQLQVKHVVIDTHVECHEKYAKLEKEIYEYMIRYSALFDNDKQHMKQIADQEVLFAKMSVELVELDKHVRDLKNTALEKDFKISELEECVCNKNLEIEKYLERLNVCENKLHKMGQTNQTIHIIMPSKDNLYNGRKGIGFENPSYFEKAKDLRSTLYDEKVVGLGSLKPYVPNVILEKIIIDLEDEVVSLLEKEKENLKTIDSLKSNGFESTKNAISKSENQCENDCLEVEKECDKVENPKVIAPGLFKLSVSHNVSPISMSKTSCDSNNVEIKLKRKRRKRKSSKQNDKQVKNDVSRANSDFVYFSDLDIFSSVRRPKHSGVIWKEKWSSNTSNVDLYSVSHSKLNKMLTIFSQRIVVMMCDVFDDNNFFIFDDKSVIISPINKMPLRKKPYDSLNVRSKRNLNKSLPRTVHKWLLKLQPLAEPIAKWILRIIQICLWIIDLGYSKHMTSNRALLTNFVEKFLGTVRFGNNDFAVIAGYGDMVIGSMTIKNVYYVEGLGHNLFTVRQFCDKSLEVAFRKSTCFVRNEDGVDFLTSDCSSNLYIIALN